MIPTVDALQLLDAKFTDPVSVVLIVVDGDGDGVGDGDLVFLFVCLFVLVSKPLLSPFKNKKVIREFAVGCLSQMSDVELEDYMLLLVCFLFSLFPSLFLFSSPCLMIVLQKNK